jgi:hypothetical protein
MPTRRIVRFRAAVVAGATALISIAGLPATAPAQEASPAPSARPEPSLGAGPSPVAEADVCAPFTQATGEVVGRAPALAGAGRALALVGGDGGSDPYACRLPAWDGGPAWTFGGTVDLANGFHWSDAAGESVDPQGEITGVGWVPVSLTKADASKLLKAKAFLTRGDAGKAIRAGRYLLVQVETSETPAASASRNLSFHLGTDRRDDPGNNAPASTGDPAGPYQDLQDVYTLYLGAGAGSPTLHSTDLAGPPLANGSPWYNARTPFAARVISDPPGVQFLLPDKAVGRSFRPISFSDAPAEGAAGAFASIRGGDVPAPVTVDQGSEVPVVPTGSDFGAIGTRLGLFPRDGIASAMVGCLEADTIHLGVTVDELRIDGVKQSESTLPSQTPVIWCTWPTFADGDILAQWFAFADADGKGETLLRATLIVREAIWDANAGRSRSRELRQATKLRITLRGGNLYVGAAVGLGSHGYHDLTGIELGSTGNEAVDAILRKSTDAALAVLPAWSVDETEGWTAGDATCLPGEVRDQMGLTPR